MVAARFGHVEAARRLLEAGAKADLVDADGKTAAELAELAPEGSKAELEAILIEAARAEGDKNAANAARLLAILDGLFEKWMLLHVPPPPLQPTKRPH